ncbi:hypothetical protein GCM10010259_15120 [Streptomyces daghestanicus]|uniref:HTH tetR-type domain-containing protein n=1 Tax=Streptomyces daghestanicus TaxID=66885 RepID=A0ABQ3Q592_9ACTN|nr:hypothetical protein GCM10010259_15120 [Streptomyces daghestanicus]GHI32444.1 hypothetical protein Sdagh_41740 [Streptomyces daghestanicus]
MTRTGGGRRRGGRTPGLDRERIVRAAVRLLDAEGLPGLSMRRLAAEPDVTATSVYWYVDTKDDLLALALDAVHAEPAPPAPGAGGDWRDRLRALAREYLALLDRHPWAARPAGTDPAPGPHAAAFAERVRDTVARAGLPACRRPGAAVSVLRFLRGLGAAPRLPEQDVEYALDLLVSGIEATARPGARPDGKPGCRTRDSGGRTRDSGGRTRDPERWTRRSGGRTRQPSSASRAGKPPVATGPHRSGVTRMIDLPCFTMAARYSSQSGCSPEMFRKYSTSGSTESGASMTSAVPSICTQGPFHSSLSTTTLTRGSRRALRVLARSGYVETTIRPESSTPQVSGDAWGLPSARRVSSSAR